VLGQNSRTSPVWLLDGNIDIRICDLLAEFGIESRTAESLGWKHLLNGRLVAAAVTEGFTCVLTRDQLFAESASRALREFPQFAVVVVQIQQRRSPEYLAQFRAAWEENAILPISGTTIYWPSNG
jgi:hypothetical protein